MKKNEENSEIWIIYKNNEKKKDPKRERKCTWYTKKEKKDTFLLIKISLWTDTFKQFVDFDKCS